MKNYRDKNVNPKTERFLKFHINIVQIAFRPTIQDYNAERKQWLINIQKK